MKENTQEKNLIEKNKKNIFSKIKNFFRKLFNKKSNDIQEEKVREEVVDSKESTNEFKEYIKKTENEDTKLLELQEKYHNREIDEKDLTEEQIDDLCQLYDKQIAEIKNRIAMKEQKLAEYKNRKIEKKNA